MKVFYGKPKNINLIMLNYMDFQELVVNMFDL